MTPKQQAFVREYLVDLNATKAAQRAGYKVKRLDQLGHSLLRKGEIAQALQEAQQARAKATGVTAERVVMELARLAFGDARAIFTEAGELRRPEDWPDDLAASIAGVEVTTVNKGEGLVEHVAKVKMWDKPRALELLARHLGMLNDKLKIDAGEELSTALEMMRAKRR